MPGQGEATQSSDRLELFRSDGMLEVGIQKFACLSDRVDAAFANHVAIVRSVEGSQRLGDPDDDMVQLKRLQRRIEIVQC